LREKSTLRNCSTATTRALAACAAGALGDAGLSFNLNGMIRSPNLPRRLRFVYRITSAWSDVAWLAVDNIIDFAHAWRIFCERESGSPDLPKPAIQCHSKGIQSCACSEFVTAVHTSGECLGENRGGSPRI
jgi:hypothetical protein